MFGEMMKMMGEVEIVARHPDGSVFATRKVTNLITSSGKRLCAMLLGLTTDNSGGQYMALGSNLTSITTSTTAIGEYIGADGAGLVRAVATTSNTLTTTSGDTTRYVKTFTCNSDNQSVQEEAIMQTDAGGWILAVQTFGAVTMNSGDTLQITHNIKIA